MAFLNSVNLLNMGAEPVKPVQNTQTNQDGASSTTTEFAQTLRKQLQQSLQKPPAAGQAPEALPNKPGIAELANQMSNTQADNKTANSQPATADKSQSAEQTAQQDADAAASAAQGTAGKQDPAKKDAAAADEGKGTGTVVQETAAERKKRMLSELSAQDVVESGVSPWMQTMIAMRPASQGAVENDTVASAKAGLPASDVPALGGTASGLPAMGDTPLPDAAKNSGPGILPDTMTATQQDSFKDVLHTETAATASPVNLNGLSETTDLARSVMDTAIEAAMAGQAGQQDKGQPFSADAPAIDALPVSQVMQNSPLTSAAGLTQTSSVVTTQIATPFGNERWQAAMNQHVMNMVGSGDEVASLTLSPPDLGPIQVVLKVDNQSVNTSFITDNPLVRQALEDGMQDLKDRMQSQGLQLGQTFVGDGQQAQQHFESSQQQAASQAQRGERVPEVGVQTAAAPVRKVQLGMVDTFV